MPDDRPRITIWNEHLHERREPSVAEHYPDGIHEAVAAPLREAGLAVRTATLDQPEHGLSDAVLQDTDVLVWWGHDAHDEVADAVVARVHQRVLDGMGLVALHASSESKVFKRLMGTSCKHKWRESGERERLWVVTPGHPIAAGLDESFEVPAAEMMGEPFDIPAPDELVFVSWFEGGEVLRSGCCFRRGLGRIFYFRPGDEQHPIYHQAEVQRVLHNAVRWAAPAESQQVRHGDQPAAEGGRS